LTKNNRAVWVLILVICLLAGCNSQAKLRDLHDYIAKLAKTTTANLKKKDITAMSLPVPAVYQSVALRDPFEESTISYTEKGMVNPVNVFPLNMLRYAGMLLIADKKWAVIVIPDGRVYQLAEGDLVGDHNGKVTRISADHLEVIEQVIDENQHTTSRLVKLQQKDGA
jgi:Tfp pilus assembly protein PilP